MKPRPEPSRAKRAPSRAKGGAPERVRPIVPLEAVVYGGTDVGRKRPGNEDSHGVWTPSDPALRQRLGVLLVVADAMGDSQSGEIASQTTEELVRRVHAHADGRDRPRTLRLRQR